ncbi:hypothetical protein BH10PSE8_BH10PSE8_10970 [soil metagenome]
MRKAGGIIALIAGIFAVIAALFTLFVGAGGKAFNASNADTVMMLGWGGVVFSFLTIVLGAVCMGATSRWPGVLLILCSLAGAVLGGTFVALFMALALVGGVLALFGRKASAAAGIAAVFVMALLTVQPDMAAAQDLKSMTLANELGSVLASEELCGLSFEQGAIAAFVEKRVRPDDLSFASTLKMMTSGNEVQLNGMSASSKTAHCTQIKRVASSYGFTK